MNALFGESFQLAGRNSYATSDISNVGQESGLETDRSDYVGRVQVVPSSNFSLTAKGRFDSQSFDPKAIELIGSAKFLGSTTTAQYANFAAQPLIGYPDRREGVLLSERYDFLDHYYVSGTATVELNPYAYDTATLAYDVKVGHPELAVLGAGLGYQDDCTTLSLNYTRSYTNQINTQSVNQTVLLSLTLRTLANINLNQNLGSTSTVQDGIYK